MEKDKKNLKTECTSAETLKSYLEYKAHNHTHFKRYATISSLQYMMDQEGIFLSTGGNWNDVSDRNAFNPIGANMVRFGACFSFSESESVAMWMLYGGLDRQGVLIDFKKKTINDCLRASNVVLGVWEKNGFTPISTINRSRFTIQLIDILYIADNTKHPDCYYTKRSTETCYIEKSIIENTDCFKKVHPWNYENECRLVLTVDINEISDRRINAAKIELPGVYHNHLIEKRIFQAPNFAGDLPNFQQSTLKSNIDWNLCGTCPNSANKNL